MPKYPDCSLHCYLDLRGCDSREFAAAFAPLVCMCMLKFPKANGMKNGCPPKDLVAIAS